MNDWSTYPFKKYIIVNDLINHLPPGVSISTMCAKCKIGTNFNLDNIRKYLILSPDDILTIKTNSNNMRTLIPGKNKKRRTKRKAKPKCNPFYNQVTVIVRINEGEFSDLNEEKKINLKLFKNGSIQISGLTNIENANRALNKLVYCLGQIKAKIEDSVIVEYPFVEDTTNLGIYDFQIYMINSNYRVNTMIDRSKLFNLLLKKKIKASYEKCIRACVIVKFVPTTDNIEEKEVSIFVFEKGNIIITGARNFSHIIDSYYSINNILLEHSDDIVKKDDIVEGDLILQLYEDIFKENSHKLKSLSLSSASTSM
jgi:TATA-box binding protein (TBP) (component of TFIID and TFIIIB)